MRLRKRADYGIRVMIDMASGPGGAIVVTKDIGRRQDIPQAFLTKIVARLTRAGLLRSLRGAAGGLLLARSSKEINLRQIIEAVEGPIVLSQCLLHPSECSIISHCPAHDIWCQAQRDLIRILEATSLQSLLEKRSGPIPGRQA